MKWMTRLAYTISAMLTLSSASADQRNLRAFAGRVVPLPYEDKIRIELKNVDQTTLKCYLKLAGNAVASQRGLPARPVVFSEPITGIVIRVNESYQADCNFSKTMVAIRNDYNDPSAYLTEVNFDLTDFDCEAQTPTLPTGQNCQYKGASYSDGEGFYADDGCNTCVCLSGQIQCSMAWCTCSPGGEWFRDYFFTRPSQCSPDRFGCPAPTHYFVNDCGCGCQQAPQCKQNYNCALEDCRELYKKCPYSGFVM